MFVLTKLHDTAAKSPTPITSVEYLGETFWNALSPGKHYPCQDSHVCSDFQPNEARWLRTCDGSCSASPSNGGPATKQFSKLCSCSGFPGTDSSLLFGFDEISSLDRYHSLNKTLLLFKCNQLTKDGSSENPGDVGESGDKVLLFLERKEPHRPLRSLCSVFHFSECGA